MLEKQLIEYDELLKKKNLTMSKHQEEGAAEDVSKEELKLKLEELQESVEVQTREANENLEKYCSLIVKYYKLEEENEMLKTQVGLLSAQLRQQRSNAVVSTPVLNSGDSLAVSNQTVKEMLADEDTTKLSSKRQRYEDDRKGNEEPRSPMVETSSKKKKKKVDIHQNVLGHKHTNGLADIPTENISPYILHRTTL
ncbi:CENPF protein, partial [Galbula dea]|nr:CENPF protein [Galbula dea]